jgi:alanine-synthesizing transaminase
VFSRVAADLHGEVNSLYRLRDEMRRGGAAVADLVSGNVNEHGLIFPQKVLEHCLAESSRQCRVYRPDSLGQITSREAIADYYLRNGFEASPEALLLTPGTSIAYWYCFKLLADEGDEIMCPQPSYPLFDYIASLSGVKLTPYPLTETRGWGIDVERLEAGLSTRTRAIVVISPHNPTGHMATADELAALAGVAARHDLAIISDEVFSEFLMSPGILPRPGGETPLVIILNGFSKMYALPGLKLGWMVLRGEPSRVRKAMRALELISDTFLPVNEAVQAAVPAIFRQGEQFRAGYTSAIRERWRLARAILAPCARIRFIEPDGGFYVSLRLEGLLEESASIELLRREQLLVHPGYFYDMKPDHLVLSFVQEPEVIREVYPRLANMLERL